MTTQCSKRLHRHCHQNLLSHSVNYILTMIPEQLWGLEGSVHGILDKTVLPRLLMGKAGLGECSCLWTPQCLKYLYFWALKVHSVFWWLKLSASEVVEWETTHVISHVFKVSCLSYVFPHAFLSTTYSQNCTGKGVTVLNAHLWVVIYPPPNLSQVCASHG
jgi:hypothetical protein